MSLPFHEAIETAWWAFLNEVGEPITPCWRGAGFVGACASETSTGRSCEGDEHWHIIFFDARAWGPNCVAARVWVDKRTGHANVWVNEDYDPTHSHLRPATVTPRDAR